MAGLVPALALVAGCTVGHFLDRGKEALDAHDLSAAERAYRKALQRDPSSAEALAGLGWTYHLAEQRVAARNAFARCAELAPRRTDCRRGLASVALAEGNAAAAREILVAALQDDPHDAGVQSSLALLEMSTGDLEGAATRYRSLVARFPDRAEYGLGLAEVEMRRGNAAAALEEVNRVLALEGTPARHLGLLHLLRARALVASTSGREDPARCADTVPPIVAWLDEADAAADRAEGTGVTLPDLPAVRRLILRRRGVVQDVCPEEKLATSSSAGSEESPGK